MMEVSASDDGKNVSTMDVPPPFSLDGGTSAQSTLENQSEETQVFEKSSDTEHRDAALLLSVAAIATKEIHIDGASWSADDGVKRMGSLSIPTIMNLAKKEARKNSSLQLSPRLSSLVSVSEMDYQNEGLSPSTTLLDGWNRVRSVSVDEERSGSPIHSSGAAIVSPLSSPISNQRPLRKPMLRPWSSRKRELSASSTFSAGGGADSKRPLHPNGVRHGRAVKTILRKKFSWKNYPEVSPVVPQLRCL